MPVRPSVLSLPVAPPSCVGRHWLEEEQNRPCCGQGGYLAWMSPTKPGLTSLFFYFSFQPNPMVRYSTKSDLPTVPHPGECGGVRTS